MSANGYLTAAELAPIGHGLFLRTDAAASFIPMNAEAQAAGVDTNSSGAASAYRPWAMQLDMRVHPALYGINPNMHALPGLPSSHGTGLARDFYFGRPNEWMIANGARWGWTRPAHTMALNDLNHWEFTPGTSTASLDATKITIPKEDEDMTLYYQPTNNSSPLTPTDASTSRIWAGTQTVDGILYADVWGASDIGDVRRLTRKQWVDLTANAASRGVTLPVIQCTGNEVEQLVYARHL